MTTTGLDWYVDKLKELEGYRQSLMDRKASLRKRIKKWDDDIESSEKAQVIIQTVAQRTQEELEYQISEICSLALASVLDDPYKLVVKFVIRRGKTECDLLFRREGKEITPMHESGGGAVDVASFALRIAMWCISFEDTAPVFIVDEPFRFLSSNLRDNASLMMKEISEKLGIQIIMVSHNERFIGSADNVITISPKPKKKTKLIRRKKK